MIVNKIQKSCPEMGLDFDENIKILNVKLSLLCSVSVPAFSSLFFMRIPKC